MKKCSKFWAVHLLSLLLISVFVLSNFGFAKAQDIQTVAASYPPFPNWTRVGSDYLAQTFYPGVNRITNAGIAICNHGNSAVKFTLALSNSGSQFLATKATSLNANVCAFRYIEPQSPLVTDGTKMHVIWIYPYQGYENNQLDLWTSSSDNSYIPGSAWKNIFTALNKDFEFVVFGYNQDDSPPAQPPAVADNQPPGEANPPAATTATENTATPSTAPTSNSESKTTTVSNKPKNLAAIYNSDKTSVDLKWEASTLAKIDHYDIFKANTTDNVFAKIDQVAKDALTYSDLRIKYSDQYLYYVVAISATTQSENSNTATITIDDQKLKPAVVTTSNADLSKWQKFKNYVVDHSWILIGLFGLLLALTILTIIIDKKRRHYKKLHKDLSNKVA